MVSTFSMPSRPLVRVLLHQQQDQSYNKLEAESALAAMSPWPVDLAGFDV